MTPTRYIDDQGREVWVRARVVYDCYRECEAEFERLCPGLRVSRQRKGTKRLTDEERQQIRDLYWTRGATQLQLARMFNVSRPTIAKIVHDKPESLPQAKRGEAGRRSHE